MTSMATIGAGAVAGAGIAVAAWPWLRPAPSIFERSEALLSTRASAQRLPWTQTSLVRVARRVAEVMGADFGRLRTDLAICHVSEAELARDKLVAALAGGGALFLVGLMLGGLGLGGVAITPAIGLVAGFAAGFTFPDAQVRSKAKVRREEWQVALAAYLDLVALAVAGGAATETAMARATLDVSGGPIAEIRRTLHLATLQRCAVWDALEDLAIRYDVPALHELTSAMKLSGTEGSGVRDTLIAKAKGMRIREVTDAEADAARTSEAMSLPVVVMLIGFIILLGYPAMGQMLS